MEQLMNIENLRKISDLVHFVERRSNNIDEELRLRDYEYERIIDDALKELKQKIMERYKQSKERRNEKIKEDIQSNQLFCQQVITNMHDLKNSNTKTRTTCIQASNDINLFKNTGKPIMNIDESNR